MAAECCAAAGETSDSDVKAQWLGLASLWQTLADDLEKSAALETLDALTHPNTPHHHP